MSAYGPKRTRGSSAFVSAIGGLAAALGRWSAQQFMTHSGHRGDALQQTPERLRCLLSQTRRERYSSCRRREKFFSRPRGLHASTNRKNRIFSPN
jgi:hypothetical protein